MIPLWLALVLIWCAFGAGCVVAGTLARSERG